MAYRRYAKIKPSGREFNIRINFARKNMMLIFVTIIIITVVGFIPANYFTVLLTAIKRVFL